MEEPMEEGKAFHPAGAGCDLELGNYSSQMLGTAPRVLGPEKGG